MGVIYCLNLEPPWGGASEAFFEYRSAWARIDPDHADVATGSRRVSQLIDHLNCDLSQGLSVALGFSVPLFIPLAMTREDLFMGRPGDDRALGGAGACLGGIVGAHAAAFILSWIAEPHASTHTFTCSARCWSRSTRPVLLAWEAFVTGPARGENFNDGCMDAATAAACFAAVQDAPERQNAVEPRTCLSLVGAAALRTGWTTDVSTLAEPCVVMRPTERFKGRIIPAT